MFIDTWGWLALRDRREDLHEEAKTVYQKYRKKNANLYTSDYVLDETFTLLFKRLSKRLAQDSIDQIHKTIETNSLTLGWINQKEFNRAKRLREKFQDKPDISFTDLTSMVIMEKYSIKKILTSDDHFTHVGKGFEILP